MIAPTWRSVKLGPLLRREGDLRSYGDLFQPAAGDLTGLAKLCRLTIGKRAAELPSSVSLTTGDGELAGDGDVVYCYGGMQGGFMPILHHHELLRNEFVSILRSQHTAALAFNFEHSATLHVRLGDFRISGLDTDLGWFVEVVRALRRTVSHDLKIYVVSDGSDEDVRMLLSLPDTKRLRFGSSAADLVALSKSRILVSSRASTFGMWGAFFGRMPWVYPPGPTCDSPVVYTGAERDKQIVFDNSARALRELRTAITAANV